MSGLPNHKVKVSVSCKKSKIYLEITSDTLAMQNTKLDMTDSVIVAIMDSMEYQARKTGYCAYCSGNRKIEFSKEGAE